MIYLGFFTAGLLIYFLILTRNTGLQRMFIICFFSTGLLFVFLPELATQIANLLGIGRGADFVLYSSVLFLFFISFNFYIKFRANDEKLTLIVRELALSTGHKAGVATRSV